MSKIDIKKQCFFDLHQIHIEKTINNNNSLSRAKETGEKGGKERKRKKIIYSHFLKNLKYWFCFSKKHHFTNIHNRSNHPYLRNQAECHRQRRHVHSLRLSP